jgi:Protein CHLORORESPIRATORY REDUCTION 7
MGYGSGQKRNLLLFLLFPVFGPNYMANLQYQEDYFVILETNQPEQILSAIETRDKLAGILADRQDDLPRGLEKFPTPIAQAQHLLDTVCELPMGPGTYLQWYAVRVDR